MKAERLPEEIFDLLAHKNYQQLTQEERSMVLKHITAEEYRELSESVGYFKNIDRSMKPGLSPSTIDDQPSTINDQPSTKRTSILFYPVPLYQVAAGLLLLIGLFLISRPSDSNNTAIADTPGQMVESGTPIAKDKYPEKLVYHP